MLCYDMTDLSSNWLSDSIREMCIETWGSVRVCGSAIIPLLGPTSLKHRLWISSCCVMIIKLQVWLGKCRETSSHAYVAVVPVQGALLTLSAFRMSMDHLSLNTAIANPFT
jgi:hypothetical protein